MRMVFPCMVEVHRKSDTIKLQGEPDGSKR